jgi:hypothetical protein
MTDNWAVPPGDAKRQFSFYREIFLKLFLCEETGRSRESGGD